MPLPWACRKCGQTPSWCAARCVVRTAPRTFWSAEGASPEQVEWLDSALAHYADCAAEALGQDLREFPGTGAAGGMGVAANAFLGAELRRGVEVVAELVGLAR